MGKKKILFHLDLIQHLVKNIDPKDITKVKEEINEAVGKVKSKNVDKIQIESIGEQGTEATGNQKIVFESFEKEFKVGGKLGKSVLIKAADENPALYNRLMNDIIGPGLKDMKDEIKEYYNTTTGKAVTGNKKEKSDAEWDKANPM